MNNQDLQKFYAGRWKISSKFFYDKGYYTWMCTKVKDYKRILEIGCGAGYSTLQLAAEEHSIIAFEKNSECIDIANKLLEEHDLADAVSFIEGDIVKDNIQKKLIEEDPVDAVICWNPGTEVSVDILRSYAPKMLEYGLTADQINGNPVSSYNEMMLWYACKVANALNVPIHIIDRCGEVGEETRGYYEALGAEVGFGKIQCDALEGETLSEKGVPLIVNGEIQHVDKMPVIFVSVMLL